MIVLGISPLDQDATASLVIDGQVVFAAGEERFSRQKQHAGFPRQSIEYGLRWAGIEPKQIDQVAYAFFDAARESELMRNAVVQARQERRSTSDRAHPFVSSRVGKRPDYNVPGLTSLDQRITKTPLQRWKYKWLGRMPLAADLMNHMRGTAWARRSGGSHALWQTQLESGLADMGITAPVKRYEHHETHAANAYYPSGFDRSLVVSFDGYGSGLCGAVSLAEGNKITRLQDFRFPYSLGVFYEYFTSALGFRPDRHAGKVVGLAAYGDPDVLGPLIRSRFHVENGTYTWDQPFNPYFIFDLAARYPMVDIAAAGQAVLEQVATEVVRYWVNQTKTQAICLSGGVVANVKLNQRLFELDGINQVFVYPNMGDGGCGTGAAMLSSVNENNRTQLDNVYYGPSYSDAQIVQALDAAGVKYRKPENLAAEVARLIDEDKVVARFDGRMEYGPRALGSRSILCSARDPHINHSLNERLSRTEFMPFAPVTLWEERNKCYLNIEGAKHAAEFMTITVNCTPAMRDACPAAVHVDGTARPQLIRREINPGYYDIVAEYNKRTGIPTVINTSFNMHEQPIVCSPEDAVRSYLQGRIDALAIGPFLAEQSPQS